MVRKMASTCHSCLYLSASSLAGRSVLLVNTEALAVRLHIAAIAAVADEGFVALLEHALECREDRFAVMTIFGGLVFIEAHDVAPILDPHFLDLQGRGSLGVRALRIDLFIAPCTPEHRLVGFA